MDRVLMGSYVMCMNPSVSKTLVPTEPSEQVLSIGKRWMIGEQMSRQPLGCQITLN